MMMSDQSRIFLNSFVLYVCTFALGLVAAWRHVIMPGLPGVPHVDMTPINGIIFVLVFAVFTIVMVRFVRIAQSALTILLAIALVSGAHFVFSSWTMDYYAMLGALGLVALMYVVPLVIVHDLAIMAGIGGIAAALGLSLTPLVACVILAVLSVYDIISVYRTRHMVVLAGRMMASGAVFGFLVPARISGFFQTRRNALQARQVMMLGSGDIGLPLVLAASAVSQSIGSAVLVGVFSLAGLTLMHWLFAHQERGAPMAALPPIAMSAIVGYAVAILLNI